MNTNLADVKICKLSISSPFFDYFYFISRSALSVVKARDRGERNSSPRILKFCDNFIFIGGGYRSLHIVVDKAFLS